MKPVRAPVRLSLGNGDSGMLTIGSIKGKIFFFQKPKAWRAREPQVLSRVYVWCYWTLRSAERQGKGSQDNPRTPWPWCFDRAEEWPQAGGSEQAGRGGSRAERMVSNSTPEFEDGTESQREDGSESQTQFMCSHGWLEEVQWAIQVRTWATSGYCFVWVAAELKKQEFSREEEQPLAEAETTIKGHKSPGSSV